MNNPIIEIYARLRIRIPVYVFHHIPKCGGTSVHDVLDNWFYLNDDYYNESLAQENPPVDLKYMNSLNCLCGHFGHRGYQLDQRYPKIFGSFAARYRYRVFSFLRDPLEMRCSLFRHQNAIKKTSSDVLAEGIMPKNNYYSRIIGVTEADYEEKLDRYFFIGIQEEMQESFDTLASVINKPKIVLPVVNKSVTSSATSSDYLSSQEIANFKQENQLDYQIYDYARKRFDRLREQLS